MTEFLKELLGDNYTEEVETKLLQAIEENYVSKEDYEKAKETSTGEDYDLKFTEMENSYKDQIRQIKLQYAIESALSTCGAKNQKAVFALLDKEQISIDENGDAVGLDEQLENLQKTDSFLFETIHAKGLEVAESSDTVYKSPNEMSYIELCDFFKTKI